MNTQQVDDISQRWRTEAAAAAASPIPRATKSPYLATLQPGAKVLFDKPTSPHPMSPEGRKTPHPAEMGCSPGGMPDLFHGQRDSAVSIGVYTKYVTAMENRRMAEESRREKKEREMLRAEEQRQKLEEALALKAAEDQSRERRQAGRKVLVERRGETVRAMREKKAQLREERESMHKGFIDSFQGRVKERREADHKMDAREEAEAEYRRQEAAKSRGEHRQRLEARKATDEEMTKQRASSVGPVLKSALSGGGKSARWLKQEADKQKVAANVAAMHARLAAAREADEQERQRRVTANKALAQASREKAAKARKACVTQNRLTAVTHQEKLIGMKDRDTIERLEEIQKHHDQIFRHRYVGAEEATEFARSSVRKLYSMDDAAEEEIAQQNAQLLQRILSTQARTDDDVMDEDAGMARGALAAARKAQKEAERAALEAANAEYRHKLANVQAKTDDDMTDEAGWQARNEIAAAHKAQKEAERAALEADNAEYRHKLANVQAKTDDDMTDEAGWQARNEIAAAHKAQKEAERAALEADNAEYRHMIKTTKSKTDDDIMDEEAGMAREGYDLHFRRQG